MIDWTVPMEVCIGLLNIHQYATKFQKHFWFTSCPWKSVTRYFLESHLTILGMVDDDYRVDTCPFYSCITNIFKKGINIPKKGLMTLRGVHPVFRKMSHDQFKSISLALSMFQVFTPKTFLRCACVFVTKNRHFSLYDQVLWNRMHNYPNFENRMHTFQLKLGVVSLESVPKGRMCTRQSSSCCLSNQKKVEI